MSNEELTELLERLSTSSGRLDEQTNALDTLIEAFERKLRDMRAGVDAWVSGDSSVVLSSKKHEETDDEGHVTSSVTILEELGWTKMGDQWHLAVRRVESLEVTGGLSPEVNVLGIDRLLDRSRQTRLKSLGLFPLLIEALTEESSRHVRPSPTPSC